MLFKLKKVDHTRIFLFVQLTSDQLASDDPTDP